MSLAGTCATRYGSGGEFVCKVAEGYK